MCPLEIKGKLNSVEKIIMLTYIDKGVWRRVRLEDPSLYKTGTTPH